MEIDFFFRVLVVVVVVAGAIRLHFVVRRFSDDPKINSFVEKGKPTSRTGMANGFAAGID